MSKLNPDDHLPECVCYDKVHAHKCALCICHRLRACEQRVRMEDDDYAYVAAQAEADGRRRGWADALDAAREAVATTGGRMWIGKAEVLAAIDALQPNS